MSTWAKFTFFTNEEKVAPALSARQSPGGYFYFWNLLVPLSVVLNVWHFGMGVHEAGLLLALAIGPHIFDWLVQNTFLAWAVLMFLFILIERILWRWPWYQVYSCTFARSVLVSLILVAVPSLFIRWIWYPVYRHLPKALSFADLSAEEASATSDNILLLASVLILMHSLYFCKPASEARDC